MPIYAYKCDSCGFAKDVLQKMSDAPLDTCPSCGEVTLKKQLTAAGFQLKGSGWYATDFKGGPTTVPPVESASDKATEATASPKLEPSTSVKADTPAAPVAPKPAPTPSANSAASGT